MSGIKIINKKLICCIPVFNMSPMNQRMIVAEKYF